MKKHVDSFTPGETAWIPHSQFFAHCTGKITDELPALECAVELMGAQLPQNKVNLNICYPKGIKVDYFNSVTVSTQLFLFQSQSVNWKKNILVES